MREIPFSKKQLPIATKTRVRNKVYEAPEIAPHDPKKRIRKLGKPLKANEAPRITFADGKAKAHSTHSSQNGVLVGLQRSKTFRSDGRSPRRPDGAPCREHAKTAEERDPPERRVRTETARGRTLQSKKQTIREEEMEGGERRGMRKPTL